MQMPLAAGSRPLCALATSLVLLGIAPTPAPGWVDDPPAATAASPAWLDENLKSLSELYRTLHQAPELSYKEIETARRVAAALREAGVEVTEGVGKTGLVGVLRNGDGPTVLLRTDLDALPVTEATGLPYASTVTTTDDQGTAVGVMHACGHDMHMTCQVGAARWLASHRDAWRGTVLFVGQPAEEKVGGARAMLADGLYRRFPKPDAALALHVAHDLEAGRVGYCSGPAFASSTSVDVVVKGRGGHGALPNEAVDPIVLASLLVLDLQTIVSRELRPIDPGVITVGSIHGGSKHNIIPSEVKLQLTLRAYTPENRDLLLHGIERRAKGLAEAHRAPAAEVTVLETTPPTINTPALVQKVVPSLKTSLGEANVVAVEPTMGAEDFGLFSADGVPTFMFRLGTVDPARMAASRQNGEPLPTLHSARYAPEPEPSLRTGVRALTSAVTALLPAR